MKGIAAPLPFHFHDRVWSHPFFRLAASVLLESLTLGKSPLVGSKLERLARAARGCPSRWRQAYLEGRLRRELEAVDLRAVTWDELYPGDEGSSEIRKAIILKPPIARAEKGVLYATFENQWMRLLRSGRAQEIADAYDLVLGPTWSPPHDAALLLAGKMWPEPVFTLLSNLDDGPTISKLSSRLLPIPLLASSWTNPDSYAPYLHLEKSIDILMLASFSRYKRHWLFFEVMRKLPRSLRIVLIGRPVDLKVPVLWDQARRFGVEDRFELWDNATDDQIARAICQSRISLIFSRQEGSCVAVAESMMGGTPVGIFHDARIGSKAFINPQTGILLDGRPLARQILSFLDQHHRFNPRPWAIENISCQVSTHTLNAAVRSHSRESGRPWTRDIAVMHQNSVPLFAHPGDALSMAQSYREFRERFGIELAFPQASLPAVRAEEAAPLSIP